MISLIGASQSTKEKQKVTSEAQKGTRGQMSSNREMVQRDTERGGRIEGK